MSREEMKRGNSQDKENLGGIGEVLCTEKIRQDGLVACQVKLQTLFTQKVLVLGSDTTREEKSGPRLATRED